MASGPFLSPIFVLPGLNGLFSTATGIISAPGEAIMSLRVGHITYINCTPFFHYLRESGFAGEIVQGVPAELNHLLSIGELDICPSSSIEYARHASDYLLLPDNSISSLGPVQSVLLFSELPLAALNGIPITITGESATSVALLEVLLREFFQIKDVVCVKANKPIDDLFDETLPMLLIGDRALKARSQMSDTCMTIDLGELWYHFTGLPFVFALWIVSRSVAQHKHHQIEEFSLQLAASRQKAFRSLAEIARRIPERAWMGEQGLVDYWQMISYDLDPLQIEGLRCFYLLLEKHGLISQVPELSFFR